MWTTDLDGGEVGAVCPLASLRGLVDNFLASMPAIVPRDARALIEPIARLQASIGREEVQITFLGAFKTGKSTLINALMGAEVLPARANRATSVITRLCTGPERSASVVRRSPDGTIYSEAILWEELARYVLLDVSEGTGRAVADIDAVSIRYPLSARWAGYVLVDTPGLLDTADSTARTLAESKRTDLAVLVLDANKFLGRDEKLVAQQVHDLLGGNVVFVVNRMDHVDTDERSDVLNQAQSVLGEWGSPLVGKPRVFVTEARRALAVRQGRVEDETALAGIIAFESWVDGTLRPNAQKIAALSRLAALTSHLVTARQAIAVSLTDAKAAAKAVLLHDAQQKAARLDRLKRDIDDDRLRLMSFRTDLARIGESFVDDCVQHLKTRMASDEEWATKIKACLDLALSSYQERVNRGVRDAIHQTSFPVPAFSTAGVRARPEMSAVPNPLELYEGVGALIGAGLGLASFGTLALGGLMAGRWLGRFVGEQKALDALRETARGIAALLRSEAERYVDARDAALEDDHRSALADKSFSLGFQAAQERVRGLEAGLSWCDEFLCVLDVGRRELEQ